MYCVKCGRQLQEDSNFCPICGAQARRAEIPHESPSRQNDYAWGTAWQQQPVYPTPWQAKPAQSNSAQVALICGIIGAALFWIIIPGFVLGIIAVIMGARSVAAQPKNNRGQGIAGLILGIAAIVLSFLLIFLIVGGLSSYMNDFYMDNWQSNLNYV